MSQSMQGKLALVTGGASGMGRICALRLAAQGARVAIFDLNEAGLTATAAEHDNITAFQCDIADRSAVEARIGEVEQQLGPVDHLVHAAALMPAHALADHDVDKLEFLFQVNFFGTVYMIKTLLPGMLECGSGTMVLFGSIAGYAFVPKMGVYCATKAAVNTYVECLQNETRGRGVNIHLVCPPAVNTPLVDQTIATDTPGSIIEARNSGRLADPEKIVDAIEKGVARGKDVIYPGEARSLQLWKILFPRLWWKTVLHFESRRRAGGVLASPPHDPAHPHSRLPVVTGAAGFAGGAGTPDHRHVPACFAGHGARPGYQHQPGAADHQRLPARLRGFSPGMRTTGGPLRPQAGTGGWHGIVHPGLRRLRAGGQH